MTARIIDGKALAREVEAQARARSEALASRPGGRRPGLAVVLVGEDPASCVYVKNKTRACERAGVISTEYRLPADTTCLLYTSPSPRDGLLSRMPSSA